MNFHIEELRKIKKATGGFFNKRARNLVGQKLVMLSMELQLLEKMSEEQAEAKALQLLNICTDARQQALANGARSYSDPDWAASAACESWMHALMLSDPPESVAVANQLVNEMIDRAR